MQLDSEHEDAPLLEQRGAESNTVVKLYSNDSTLLARWRLLGEACRDPKMNRASLAVLHSIADRIGKDGTAWPSIRKIARDTGLDNRTVMRGINLSVERGFLIRQSGNRIEANVYRLGMGENARRVLAHSPVGADRPVGAKRSQRCGQELQKGVGELVHVTYSENLPKEPTHVFVQAGSAPPDTASQFDEFWKAYPRKESRKKAEAIWKSRKLDRIAEKIIQSVRDRVAQDPKWRERQFVPMPVTFINGDRWMDEWIPEPSAGTEDQPPAHLTAVEKVEWHMARRKLLDSAQRGGRLL